MARINKPAPFTILATGHGSMIVNRNDYYMTGAAEGVGVGLQLFATSLFDADEVDTVLELLRVRRGHFGDGVVALDCGANIGVHTLEWAALMTGWGTVIAFEPQERIYYALAGNLAINNLFNARAVHAAVGTASGAIQMPLLDYTRPSSFGSLELKPSANPDVIGQPVDYQSGPKQEVNLVALDDLGCARVDFIKLDVEGMELEALQGAQRTIATCKPILLVEYVKAQPGTLEAWLKERGYRCFKTHINILAIHETDPSLGAIADG
jgi:FkbM family methyltransferase